MNLSRVLPCSALAFLLGTASATAQSKIVDIVRSSPGGIELIIDREYSPASLSDLVDGSDLVARVLIGQSRSRLSRDEEDIETDYQVQILERYVSRPRASTEENIVVVRPGGEISVEGRRVVASEPDFPPFDINEEYVLFLRFDPQGKTYIVPRGAQGAFRLSQGLAEQVTQTQGLITAERGKIPLDTLAQEVRELARR